MSDSIWSSVVTGGLAFCGVVVGLIWNAWHARKIEERVRKNARAVLRTSLKAELIGLANLMTQEIDWIENNNFTWVPLVQSFQIYLTNIQNLGLLTPTEAQKIVEAYYQYQESAFYLAKMAEDKSNEPAIGRPIGYDFSKPQTVSKSDVIDNLAPIISTAKAAAYELEEQRRNTGD